MSKEIYGIACSSVLDKCYNLEESYGEICVRCNCCGRIDKKTMYQCRVEHDKQMLQKCVNDLFHEWRQSPVSQITTLGYCLGYIKRIKKSMKKIGDRHN